MTREILSLKITHPYYHYSCASIKVFSANGLL
jgi:hypothetical protein